VFELALIMKNKSLRKENYELHREILNLKEEIKSQSKKLYLNEVIDESCHIPNLNGRTYDDLLHPLPSINLREYPFNVLECNSFNDNQTRILNEILRSTFKIKLGNLPRQFGKSTIQFALAIREVTRKDVNDDITVLYFTSRYNIKQLSKKMKHIRSNMPNRKMIFFTSIESLRGQINPKTKLKIFIDEYSNMNMAFKTVLSKDFIYKCNVESLVALSTKEPFSTYNYEFNQLYEFTEKNVTSNCHIIDNVLSLK